MGNRIYGCDDCLAVCPWNRFADAAAANRAFLPRAELAAPRLADLLALDDAAFREMFAGSPIKRIGRNRMVRNCLIAAGNSGDQALAAASVEHASRRSRPGDRRSGALGARSARSFERGDAGRLIDVGARRQARVDVGDLAACRRSRRVEIGVEHAARAAELQLEAACPRGSGAPGVPKCADELLTRSARRGCSAAAVAAS